MHTFHQVLCNVLADYGYEAQSVFAYDKFRMAWYTYLNLLDIDLNQGFSCSICTAQPDIVVCDGTSVSFQRRMWHSSADEVRPETAFPNQKRYVIGHNLVASLHCHVICEYGQK